jgi:hypothetical protein
VADVEQITDAEVVDVDLTPELVEDSTQGPSTQLVRRERRSEVLRPLDTEAVLASFDEYQQLVQRILTPKDWQGRPNAEGSFVKKKGWRKIATAFDLDVRAIPGMSRVERDENGNAVRAEVWVRAVSPAGRVMDGDGYCSADEPRFAGAKGRQKLENDLRATATTRAKNRAISDLVGMGDVSAEEVDVGGGDGLPPFGPAADGDLIEKIERALGYMLDSDSKSDEVKEVLRAVYNNGGNYYPRIALLAIGFAASHLLKQRQGGVSEGDVARAERLATEHQDATVEPGSVLPPGLGGQSEEKDLEVLRGAGCSCPGPLSAEFDSDCPLKGHGIAGGEHDPHLL